MGQLLEDCDLLLRRAPGEHRVRLQEGGNELHSRDPIPHIGVGKRLHHLREGIPDPGSRHILLQARRHLAFPP